MSFFIPRTLHDVQTLIENAVQESVHLDYKASEGLKRHSEIAKDVSSFANSDGGVIIYGVTEDGHRPEGLDQGTPHSDMSRERLEDLIQSNVSPRLGDLEIIQLEICESRSIYVVAVGRSPKAPHQERAGFRYYKRHNFKSSPMEDYEIQDIRNRVNASAPSVVVDVEVRQGQLFHLFVENVGAGAAIDVKFEFSTSLTWMHDAPEPFLKGMRVLSKGRKLSFLYASAIEALQPDSKIATQFSVDVSYTNPMTKEIIQNSFVIDLKSFLNSSVERSEIHQLAEKIESGLKQIAGKVDRLHKTLETFEPLCGPTGLDFSITTLRALSKLLDRPLEFPKLQASAAGYRVFREVLGVDLQTAIHIHRHFRQHKTFEELLADPQVSGESKELLKKHFVGD